MRRTILFIIFFLQAAVSYSQQAYPEDMLLNAVEKFTAGNYAAARDSLNAAVAADSTLDAAYYYLGMLDYSSKNFEGALEKFKKAHELDSANLWYEEALASVYSAMGNSGVSTQIYLDLLAKDPKKYRNNFTLSMLADQTLAQGNDSLALDYYDQALLYDPDYIPAKLGRAEALMQSGKFKESFAAVSEVLADSRIQEDPKIQYLTGLLRSFNPAQWTEFREDILNLVQAVRSAHPDSEKPLGMEVEIRYLYSDYSGALQCFQRMLTLPGLGKERRVEILANIGDLCHETGNEQECFGYYEKALELNPDYAPVLNNYAYFLALKPKKLHKALRMSAKTVEAEPDNPTYLDTYGWILFLLGRAEEAKPYFKHALIYGGSQSDEILAHYSRVLEVLGEKDLAEYYKLQIGRKK